MKLQCRAWIILLMATYFQNGFTQNLFTNLNFENPILPLNPVNYEVPISDGLPGWTGYLYGGQADLIALSTVSLGAAEISLQGPGSHEPIFQGNYSVILQGSTANIPSGAAIGQTGQIPANAKSLFFYGLSSSGIQVSFDGNPVSVFEFISTPKYQVIAGDISAYAGHTGELLFAVSPNSEYELDNIVFSTLSVPEPRSGLLMLCGAILFVFGSWRRGRDTRCGWSFRQSRGAIASAPSHVQLEKEGSGLTGLGKGGGQNLGLRSRGSLQPRLSHGGLSACGKWEVD